MSPKTLSKPSKKTNEKIKRCEEKIIALEEEQATAQKALEAGNHSPEFLRALSQRQKEIERLYEELEALSKEQK